MTVHALRWIEPLIWLIMGVVVSGLSGAMLVQGRRQPDRAGPTIPTLVAICLGGLAGGFAAVYTLLRP